MISIVDYGMGNSGSILNMVRRAGGAGEIVADPDAIATAKKLILPGVGAFDAGVSKLRATGLDDALETAVMERKVPILGICLGLQLFTRGSEEGLLPGLGWVSADTVQFRIEPPLKLRVPHMGWNRVVSAKNDVLIDSLPAEPQFYFVHSFHLVCDDEADVLTWTEYGIRFASGVRLRNIWGTQFHPEKSHKYGLGLIKNFVNLV